MPTPVFEGRSDTAVACDKERKRRNSEEVDQRRSGIEYTRQSERWENVYVVRAWDGCVVRFVLLGS